MKSTSKIAIVGLGGVFPGARDLEEFWQNILSAKDTAIDVGADRWRLDPNDLYSPNLEDDKVNSRRACLVQDFKFNPDGFNIDADLLKRLDPLYQILLHAGRDAWADAKTEKIKKERVGIIIGNIVLLSALTLLFKLNFLQIQWVGALAIGLILGCFGYMLLTHYRKVADIEHSPKENKIDFTKIELMD